MAMSILTAWQMAVDARNNDVPMRVTAHQLRQMKEMMSGEPYNHPYWLASNRTFMGVKVEIR